MGRRGLTAPCYGVFEPGLSEFSPGRLVSDAFPTREAADVALLRLQIERPLQGGEQYRVREVTCPPTKRPMIPRSKIGSKMPRH